MENVKSIFPEQLSQSLPVKQIDKTNLKDIEEEKKIQVAKDYESILINNLLDQMKNTVGSWGFEKDSASSQVDGIFWLHLARDISNKGGFGLWKDIYESMPGNEQVQQKENSIGKE
jgi:Rod binding domain-containing protein